MIYQEGEGYVLGPSPIDDVAVLVVVVLAFFFPMGMYRLGYWAGHNAATAAIHKESS
jgi:hypothetical protein